MTRLTRVQRDMLKEELMKLKKIKTDTVSFKITVIGLFVAGILFFTFTITDRLMCVWLLCLTLEQMFGIVCFGLVLYLVLAHIEKKQKIKEIEFKLAGE